MTRNIAILMTAVLMLFNACKQTEAPDLSPLFLGTKTVSISALKALSKAPEVILPAGDKGLQITGVVISDHNAKNIDPNTVVLQSEEVNNNIGIVIQFDSLATFKLGDKIVVNLSGQKLVQKNGEIILIDIPFKNAKSNGIGFISNRITTLAQAIKNADLWNGTLITFYDGELSGGNGKYSGSLLFKETGTSGTINSKINADAIFQNTAYPKGVSTLTGILRKNGTALFIDIRNTEDVISSEITRTVDEDMRVIGIFKNPYSTVWSDPDLFSADIETSFSKYAAGYVAGYRPPYDADQDFLQRDRSYFYFYTTYGQYADIISNVLTIPNLYALKSIKRIRITFAGSKATGTLASNEAEEKIIVKPFKSGTDIFKLRLEFSDNGYGIDHSPVLESVSFKQTGTFYTATFTIPSRAEILRNGPSEPSAAALFTMKIDQWLATPGFKIKNQATRSAADPDSFDEPYAPIIISKIEYDF